ncbi:MAG: acetylglutamate kinase [Spirochaetes bacterium]|nr:MAG: acetylglutamate kinase [Spirochaetota bacterium]
MKKESIIIKIGGKASSDRSSLENLLGEVSRLAERHRLILVHGGGAEVSRITELFGLKPVFRDGIRMTSPAEMEIVDMVLAGKVNKYLVRVLNRYCNAVGLSGSDGRVFEGESLRDDENPETHTGRVTSVNISFLNLLMDAGFLPVLASTSMDSTGMPLNINADEVAFAVAMALPASVLLFLSDIPGIIRQGVTLKVVNKLDDIERYIDEKTITGGMIPKVKSSLDALNRGVDKVIIGQYSHPGDLEKLLSGQRGTIIRREAENEN